MKLATKKFFHNVLALAVSICMVCTLTPSAAWASSSDPFYDFTPSTSGSGSASGEATTEATDDDTASASTEVKAKVYDVNFKFETMTPGQNYPSKEAFAESIDTNPLSAVFNKDSLPEKFTVTWNVWERVENPDYPDSSDEPTILVEGAFKKLSSTHYSNPSEVSGYAEGKPTFTLDQAGYDAAVAFMQDGKIYEFSAVLTADDDPDMQAKATTNITLFPNYKNVPLYGSGSFSDYQVSGDIFVTATIFPLDFTYPKLSVSSVTQSGNSAVYSALQAEASKKGEEINTATELNLTELGSFPTDKGPYLSDDSGNGLMVFIPLPEDSTAQEGDLLYVYGYNQTTGESTGSPKTIEATVESVKSEDKSKEYLAAAFLLQNTGATLGIYALGAPMSGSCKLYVSADEGGMISPGGDAHGLITQPLSREAKLFALPYTTGYKFVGYEVEAKGNGETGNTPITTGLTESGNSLTFTPSTCGIQEGAEVEVHAKFEAVPASESAQMWSVSGTLGTSDGATGSMTIAPATSYKDAPSAKEIKMGEKNIPLDSAVNDYAGLLISFSPDKNSFIDYVKVNGNDLVFNYASNQVLIGALSANTNIEVGYRKKVDDDPDISTLPTVDVIGQIETGSWPTGVTRARLYIDGVPSSTDFTYNYSTPAGTSQTIDIWHSKDYRVEATRIDSRGVAVNVTDKMVTTDKKDSITVYNVTNEVTIKFDYVPKEAQIGGTTSGGGTGQIIVDPLNPTATSSVAAKSSKVKSMARARAAATEDQDFQIGGAGSTLAVGERARITATPSDGNEISRIEVNNTNVTQFFKAHVSANGKKYYTMTVYRTESGIVPVGAGKWLDGDPEDYAEFYDEILKEYPEWAYDKVEDNVLPLEAADITVEMKFAPKVPTSSSYRTITTHVEGVGGTITPSFKAEEGTNATIQFFPDDTYKVKEYRVVDGGGNPVVSEGNDYSCTFKVGNYNLDVYVSFEGGNSNLPEVFTITPQASTKGVISPSEPVKVYKGSSFSFSILPRTGYVLGTPTLTPAGDLKMQGYTCTINNVSSDYLLTPVFESSDDIPDPTHTVTTKVGSAGGGSIKPAGPFTVVNGGSASFTFWPDDGWYVKGVYAVDSGMPAASPDGNDDDVDAAHGINLVGSVKDGRMFTLSGIESDTELEVVFAELSELDGEDKESHTPPPLSDDDTFTLNPTEATDLGPGATISPNLSDMKFVRVTEDGKVHAAAGLDLTIIIASGYALDDAASHGGVTITNGEDDVTDNVSVKPAGDGLYAVTIPAKNVTPDMKITVNTVSTKATSENIAKASVKVSSSGDGIVSPSGDESDGNLQVEEGKSQTFSFIPQAGNKLYRLYVNDEPITITGNSYTMHNIRGENTLQAVFVPQEGAVRPATQHVMVSAGAHGKVEPTGDIEVVNGASLSILVMPDAGYKAVATEGGTPLALIGNTIELTNIQNSRNISVSFVADTDAFYTLSVGCTDGGSVSPAGNTLLAHNTTQTVSILPDKGKAVQKVELTDDEGIHLGKATAIGTSGITYTTPPATGNMSVKVTFCDSTDSNRDKDLPTGDQLRTPNENTTYRTVTALVKGGGGAVVPNSAKVANGANLTFTIVPLEGYVLDTAVFNGSNVKSFLANNGTTLIRSITTNSTFEVSFVKSDNKAGLEQYYTVFASSQGNGTISPSGPVIVSGGGSQSFTIMPDPNYKVASITISNTATSEKPKPITNFKGSTYTLFSVTSDLNFQVIFAPVEAGETPPAQFMTHTITASASVNGSISPAGSRSVAHGGDAMFSFIPWDGYKLSYIIVDGVNVRAKNITNMQYTFPNVTEDHTIQAVFIGENEKADNFVTVNVSSNRNGTVSPGNEVLIDKGSNLVIDVTPFYGYTIEDIKVGALGSEGTSIKTSSAFDFTSGTITTNPNYGWRDGQLTLKSVMEDMSVDVRFTKSDASGGDNTNAPDYGKLGSSVSPAGTGSTSIQPNPIYFEQPGDDATPGQKQMDITIVPEEGKSIREVIINYGDGSKTVINEDGTLVYGKDGTIVDTRPDPNAQTVYEDGYVTVDTDKGDVSVKVEFRDLTTEELDDIQNGLLIPATYLEVSVTYSAGGIVGPSGTVKAAKNSNLTLQMIPNSGYTVASVTDNGENKTTKVTSTRTYIVENIQSNHTVNVNFGFKRSEDGEEETPFTLTAKVVNSDPNSGTVSPAETKVRAGSNQIIYFLPAAGYKIGNLTVTRAKGTPEERKDVYPDYEKDVPAYNSPSMSIRNIASDVEVEVEYVPGENSWTVQSVPLYVEVGAGLGEVSPAYIELPVGSAAEVNFFPKEEWTTAYYTLNGQTYTLPRNVSSWPVTPDPSAQGDDANHMKVFFEHYAANDVDQVINVKLVDSGDGQPHGSASPSQATVPYAGSTTFYVYPEIGTLSRKAYTIEYVKFNGVEQSYEGVVHANQSNKMGCTVSNGAYPSGLPSSLVSQTDINGFTGAEKDKTYYNAYRVTLNDVVTSGTLEIKFKQVKNGSANIVTTKFPTMTVTSVGGGMVSPIGEVKIPEGETLDILTTAFESYYLHSVIKTDGDGKKTDLTGSVEGRVAKAVMGNTDCKVEVTFKRVTTDPDLKADVNVSLTKATYNNGKESKDITDQVEIGGYIDPDTGKLVPITLNEDRVLCDEGGKPIDYVRGGAYEFYFNPKVLGDNGRNLVLSSAKYDGKAQSIIPGANYLTNVILNSSGGFELEFRELNEGEQELNPAEGFYIVVEAHNEEGTDGIVTPAGPFTRQRGGSVEIAFGSASGNPNVSVSRIYLDYMDELDQYHLIDVDPSEYATGTYRLNAIDQDYTIHVVFQEFSIVRVDWDNSLGFITPNHEPGSYIYRPTGTAELPFLVAPYENNELLSIESGTSADSLSPIQYAEDNDNQFADELNEKLGLTTQGGGISTMSVAAKPDVIVQPTQNAFAKVVQASVPLGKNTYVRANFKGTQQFHYIEASVKGEHGTVIPSGTVEVAHGSPQTFTTSAEPGYTVVGMTIDGKKMAPQNVYTFPPVVENHTIVFEFGLPGTNSSASPGDRLVRVASKLAQTGDLTGPVVGMFLVIAALGLTVTGVSYIRRQQRRRRRMQGVR